MRCLGATVKVSPSAFQGTADDLLDAQPITGGNTGQGFARPHGIAEVGERRDGDELPR